MLRENVFLLKIGGSALTNKKSGDIEINWNRLDTIVSEVKKALIPGRKMVLITGVGVHGHVPVLRHRLHEGWRHDPNQLVGLVEAQYRVNLLRNALVKIAWDHEVPIFQCYASSIIRNDKGRIVEADLDNLVKFLDLGLIPVISGDVVPDSTMRFSVCSGDDIIFLIARELGARAVYFGMDVDGILTKSPTSGDARVISHLTVSKARNLVSTLENADASGGIRNKLNKSIMAIENDIVEKVVFFNLLRTNLLRRLLNHEKEVTCTILWKS